MISLVARRRPLLFFSLPGLLLTLSGMGLGLRVAHVFNASGELAIGYAILTTLVFTVGMLLGITGVILHSMGHLVGRLSEEVHAVLERSLREDREAPPRAAEDV